MEGKSTYIVVFLSLLLLSPSFSLSPPQCLPSFSPTHQLPEDFEVIYSQVQGEIVVGGVFLRLFIMQPTWVSILLM